MANVFDAIKNTRYNRPAATVLVKQQLQPAEDDVVSQWKKNKSPENTKKVLQYLKPTIQSALHTYAPNQEQAFRLKATSMALSQLDKYQPSKGSSPRTFVFTSLQRLNRLRRERQTPIHIPESQVYAKKLIDQKRSILQDKLGREPSDQQLSDFVGISKAKLNKLNLNSATVNTSSAQDTQSGHDLLGTSQLSDKDYYNYVYDSVSPVDQKIMQWSSGMNGKQLSNNEIAHKLNLSPGAVSQRKAKIQELMGKVRGLL